MPTQGQNISGDADLAGRRLVIVSNRLPFNISVEAGQLAFHPSAGGLVTGLASFRAARDKGSALTQEHLWVGWPGNSVDDELREQVVAQAFE